MTVPTFQITCSHSSGSKWHQSVHLRVMLSQTAPRLIVHCYTACNISVWMFRISNSMKLADQMFSRVPRFIVVCFLAQLQLEVAVNRLQTLFRNKCRLCDKSATIWRCEFAKSKAKVNQTACAPNRALSAALPISNEKSVGVASWQRCSEKKKHLFIFRNTIYFLTR